MLFSVHSVTERNVLGSCLAWSCGNGMRGAHTCPCTASAELWDALLPFLPSWLLQG